MRGSTDIRGKYSLTMITVNQCLRWMPPLLLLLLVQCKPTKEVPTQGGGWLSKKVLTEVRINNVELVQWPRYGRDNEKWDSFAPLAADPDVFITMSWNGQPVWKSEVKEDVSGNAALSFIYGLPLIVKPFDQPIRIEIMDEDGVSSDDNMGYFDVVFTEYQKENTVILQSKTGDLALKLTMEWKYE